MQNWMWCFFFYVLSVPGCRQKAHSAGGSCRNIFAVTLVVCTQSSQDLDLSVLCTAKAIQTVSYFSSNAVASVCSLGGVPPVNISHHSTMRVLFLLYHSKLFVTWLQCLQSVGGKAYVPECDRSWGAFVYKRRVTTRCWIVVHGFNYLVHASVLFFFFVTVTPIAKQQTNRCVCVCVFSISRLVYLKFCLYF